MPSISCFINHTTPLLLVCNLSRPQMAKPRANQHSIGRSAHPRQAPRRSERITSFDATQTPALQQTSLSVQAPKQGVDASPLATTGRQAVSLASGIPPRKRRNSEGKPDLEISLEFQQINR